MPTTTLLQGFPIFAKLTAAGVNGCCPVCKSNELTTSVEANKARLACPQCDMTDIMLAVGGMASDLYPTRTEPANTSKPPAGRRASIDREDVRSAATGRWLDVLVNVGGFDRDSLDGRHRPCPRCGGTDRFRLLDESVGAVICNQCFSTSNGDGFASVGWLRDWNFQTTLNAIAAHLGVGPREQQSATVDVVAEIARLKKMPLESFKAFGAKVAKRGKMDVARVPMFGPDREQCSNFDFATMDAKWLKGMTTKGKPSGLFVAAWPAAGETVLITEGVKDAAALHGLGFLAVGIPTSDMAAKFARVFAGCHVIIVPDRDVPGELAANTKTAARLAGVAASVRVATLPGELKEAHGDGVREVIARKDGEALLRQAIADAVEWKVEDHPEADAGEAEPNESAADPHRLARLFISENTHADGLPTIKIWRSVWYRWHDGYYEPLDADEMRCRIVASMKAEFDRINIGQLKKFVADDENPEPPKVMPVTVAAVTGVMQALRSLCLLPATIEAPSLIATDETTNIITAEPAKHLVSLRNGVLDLRKFLDDADDVVSPHSPRLFTLAALPIDFDPAATCPLWDSFLARNLNNDDRSTMLQEWFGICATFNNSFQSFLMLEGSGSNGKSVICSVLTAFLGLRNVSHVPLECFGETFHLSGTVGKLANIVSEIGEVEKANEGTLKSYTSGDRMTFNRKNLPLFEAVPTARLVMATNSLPRFADRSNGVWRRMLLLPLDVVIGDAERVAGMDSVEWWSARPKELAGILLWALTGLARLVKSRHFTRPESMLAGMAEYQLDCFPARRFLSETYENNEQGEVSTHEVYQLYRNWCEENGNKPQAANSFAKEIRKVFPSAKIKRWVIRHDGKKGPGYTGFEIREQPSLEQQAQENHENQENKKSETLF